jgi:hypothetical protein
MTYPDYTLLLPSYPKVESEDALKLVIPANLADSLHLATAPTACFVVGESLLIPIAKTDSQIAYKVRTNGLLIGLIFHVRSSYWQCGDGKRYESSVDAIASLEKI